MEVYASWYTKRSLGAIWTSGNPHKDGRPRFDSESGASLYSMTAVGGSFDLNRWYADCLPNGPCNSYDLAAMIQLACAVLINPDGVEFVRSRWVFQQPNGFVMPGTLYGRDDVSTCNNPFFMLRLTAPNIDPTLNPLNPATNRSSFLNRAWVEVNFDFQQSDRVLDATHCLGGEPECGDRMRPDYYNAHTDQTWNLPSTPTGRMFGNLDNNGSVYSMGNCCEF